MIRSSVREWCGSVSGQRQVVLTAPFSAPKEPFLAAQSHVLSTAKRTSQLLPLILLLAVVVAGAACGGGSKPPTAPAAISVSLSNSSSLPSTLPAYNTVTLTADVSNDSFNDGVTWTATCGSNGPGACGTFPTAQGPSSTGTSGSDVPEVYTAPAAVPSGNTVTITATSVSDSTKSANVSFTIGPAMIVTITPEPSAIPPSTQAGQGQQAQLSQVHLTAAVTNDPGKGGIKWSCTSTPCGTFNPATTASGVPTTYTAPTSSGSSETIMATAVDSTAAISNSDPCTMAQPGFACFVAAIANVTIGLTGFQPAIGLGQQEQLVATVSNDPNTAGVTWSCSPVGSCGTFGTGATQVQSPTQYTVTTAYTAPTATPADNGIVTVVATTVTDSISATQRTTVMPPSLVFTEAPSAVPPGLTGQFIGTVEFDSSPTVSWNCTPSPCGSFTPNPSPSGTATTYSAPSTLPLGSTVTVTATSSDGLATNSTPVFIGTTLPNGTYVFSLKGPEALEDYSVAGAFSIAGGQITGGEQDLFDRDYNDFNGVVETISSGTISFASGSGDLLISLQGEFGDGEVLDVSQISPTRFLLSQFDQVGGATSNSGALAIGTMELQTSTAAPSGPFAFELSGINANGGGVPIAVGGVMNFTSGTGAFDISQINNTEYSGQPFNLTVASAPDTYGRVTLELASITPNQPPAIGLAGYMVDASHMRLMETQNAYQDSFGGTLVGVALGQAGTLSGDPVTGSSYVFAMSGQDDNPQTGLNSGTSDLQTAGILTFSSGSVSGVVDYNDLTGASVQGAAVSGSYTLDQSNPGRITLTLTGSPIATLQLYVTGTNTATTTISGEANATLITMDTSPVDELAGVAYVQSLGSSPSFTGTYALNAIGSNPLTLAQGGIQQETQHPMDAVGSITASSGALGSPNPGKVDLEWPTNDSCAIFAPGASFTGTFNTTVPANGIFTGTVTGLDVLALNPTSNPICTTTSTGAPAFDYYMIDPNQIIGFETDNQQLTLIDFELCNSSTTGSCSNIGSAGSMSEKRKGKGDKR